MQRRASNTQNRIISVGWRARFLQRYGMESGRPLGRGESTMPNWMVGSSVLAFLIAFAVCTIIYGHAMPFVYASYSILSYVFFFYGTRRFSEVYKSSSTRSFSQNLFKWALLIRIIWVVFSYAVYNPMVYGNLGGSGDDHGWYMVFGHGIADWLQSDNKAPFSALMAKTAYDAGIDDTGYPFWLGILYTLFGFSDVFVPFLVKAIVSAYSCLCVYRLANRHFGEGTARLAGLFMCFNPYSLFYCSSMLKETEMMFLCCVYLDKTDEALSSGNNITVRGLLPGILAALALFFFRAPLGIIAILAILAHLIFASTRVMSAGKKVLVGLMVGLVLMVGMGDRMRTTSDALINEVKSGEQSANMEWRSERSGGNIFAKYAGAAVFAPMIFTIPFPSFNMANVSQIMQMELSGGNFIKNVLSYFVIVVLVLMVISGEWRRHVFILTYTLGYHMVLALSHFAQSGRFHMPVWPMFLLLAAYGIQIAKGNMRLRKGFTYVLIIEVFICLAWGWFKLAGRGLV